jgi:hypothetical protein
MATIKERLDEARDAYHALNTGNMARVIVDQDGQRTEFVAANAAKLYAYIQSLEAQLPTPGVCYVPSGPVGFVF